MSEVEDFLKDTKQSDESVLDRDIATEATPEKVEDKVDDEQSKNRAYRRMESKYQREREAGIAMAERIKVLSEVGKFREDVGDDSLKEVEAIFGTDTAEKLAATNILKKALSGMGEKAKQAALEALDSRQTGETKAQREAEDEIDAGIEEAEDETGLDLSEGSADRQGFLTLVERLAKKDRDGNIVEYPDFATAAEVYQQRKERPSSSRARELASRSMTRSGESQPSKLEQTAQERYLQENGLIF
jgi:hypothetical protein